MQVQQIEVKSKPFLLLLILYCLTNFSCKNFLEERPTKSAKPITTTAEVQALLDYNYIMNEKYTAMTFEIDDYYYIADNFWSSTSLSDRLNYIWDGNVTKLVPWALTYTIISNTNAALRALATVPVTSINQASYNSVKGQGLFFRSHAYFYLAQTWCKPYSSTASTDPGIPLRLIPDLSVPSERGTVKETYDQMISDLKTAAELLPETNVAISRPNKAAAFGALSRTYLSMRDYVNAGRYADSCLKHYGNLMNYNNLDPNSPAPIDRFNPETIFYAIAVSTELPNANCYVDTTLYQSYNTNDLRKVIFYYPGTNGKDHLFKGSYDGTSYGYSSFCGIATDEIYLTRAECAARAGLKDSAMGDLNRLLVTRWKTGTFVPYTAANATDALNKVLDERRKELAFRGLRWTDLRRLNLEGGNITLKRIVNGTTYTLPPNDLRWVLLIPWESVYPENGGGIAQNPR
jgi:hypothetical protein